MIALAQRVSQARVEVEGSVAGSIEKGLLILLGVAKGDSGADAAYLAGKLAHMRIFDNAQGAFDLSLIDVGGQALVAPQFTLLGSWRKGRRPGFDKAAPPEDAAPLVTAFAQELEKQGVAVQRGIFGAHTQVHLVNDGPVTFYLDTRSKD